MNHKNSGLTLIEVLVVVTILSVLGVTLYTVFKSGVDSWSKATTKLEIYQNVRVALGQMSRELASAIAIEGTPSFCGVNTNPDKVSFIAIIEDSLYEIIYSVDTNTDTLQRGYGEDPDYDFDTIDGTADLAYNISEVQFKYWTDNTTVWENGNGAIAALDIWTDGGDPREDLPRAVRITVTDSEEDREFETVIYLPNSE